MGRTEVQFNLDDLPGMVTLIVDLAVERDRLREAVDDALAICAEYTETPLTAKPEPCEDACDGYCHHDARFATADRIARELRRATEEQSA